MTHRFNPSTPRTSVTPCWDACDPGALTANTLTPAIRAVSIDEDNDVLDYTFQVRAQETQTVVASGTRSALQNTKVEFPVPAGALANETMYEYRVGATDGTATTWTPGWYEFGVDIDELPDAPTLASLSPCASACATGGVTSSLTPVFMADVDDPDSGLLGVTAQITRSGYPAINLDAGIVAGGEQAQLVVPPNSLVDGGSYQLVLKSADDSNVSQAAPIPFSVALPAPSLPAEPKLTAPSPCTGTCATWQTSVTTPTVNATNQGSSTRDIRFELRTGDAVTSHVVTTVAAEANAAWSIPSGLLGYGTFEVRAGAVDSAGTRWTAWREIQVAALTGATDFPTAEGEENDPAYNPAWAPTPSKNSDDATALPMTRPQRDRWTPRRSRTRYARLNRATQLTPPMPPARSRSRSSTRRTPSCTQMRAAGPCRPPPSSTTRRWRGLISGAVTTASPARHPRLLCHWVITRTK